MFNLDKENHSNGESFFLFIEGKIDAVDLSLPCLVSISVCEKLVGWGSLQPADKLGYQFRWTVWWPILSANTSRLLSPYSNITQAAQFTLFSHFSSCNFLDHSNGIKNSLDLGTGDNDICQQVSYKCCISNCHDNKTCLRFLSSEGM